MKKIFICLTLIGAQLSALTPANKSVDLEQPSLSRNARLMAAVKGAGQGIFGAACIIVGVVAAVTARDIFKQKKAIDKGANFRGEGSAFIFGGAVLAPSGIFAGINQLSKAGKKFSLAYYGK